MPLFTSCIIPDGGYPTQDGYLRVLTKPRREGGKLKMLHRIEWEKIRGPIPSGYEVDHRCKNRQCQNVGHMQLLSKSDHRTKDNGHRYLEDVVKHLRWIQDNPGLKPKEVAKELDITRSKVESLSRTYPEIRPYIKMRKFNARRY